jgi:hypothetical protein
MSIKERYIPLFDCSVQILPPFLDYFFGITFRGLSMNFWLYIARTVPKSTLKIFLSLLFRYVIYVWIWINL